MVSADGKLMITFNGEITTIRTSDLGSRRTVGYSAPRLIQRFCYNFMPIRASLCWMICAECSPLACGTSRRMGCFWQDPGPRSARMPMGAALGLRASCGLTGRRQHTKLWPVHPDVPMELPVINFVCKAKAGEVRHGYLPRLIFFQSLRTRITRLGVHEA